MQISLFYNFVQEWKRTEREAELAAAARSPRGRRWPSEDSVGRLVAQQSSAITVRMQCVCMCLCVCGGGGKGRDEVLVDWDEGLTSCRSRPAYSYLTTPTHPADSAG